MGFSKDIKILQTSIFIIRANCKKVNQIYVFYAKEILFFLQQNISFFDNYIGFISIIAGADHTKVFCIGYVYIVTFLSPWEFGQGDKGVGNGTQILIKIIPPIKNTDGILKLFNIFRHLIYEF